MGILSVDETPFTLKITFQYSEYIYIIWADNYVMSHLYHLKHFNLLQKSFW